MMNQPLISYIKTGRSHEMSENDIEKSLLDTGWEPAVIKQAFIDSQSSTVPLPPPPTPPPTEIAAIKKHQSSHYMWDTFEHTLMFISLYVLAITIVLMLHFFIDRWFPKIDVYSTSVDTYSDFTFAILRGYMASLIVAYPLFSFFFLRNTKRTLANPQIRSMHSRKSLIYITLVATFLIVLFHVVQIVYNFLQGDTTLNFLLHVLATVGVSGAIFGYYVNEVKEDRKLYG